MSKVLIILNSRAGDCEVKTKSSLQNNEFSIFIVIYHN